MRALAVTIFLVGSSLPASAQSVDAPAIPYIETVGTGERRVVPDRATIHIVVTTKAASAASAAATNSQRVQSVRDTLKKLGLDSVVTTASYNVGPDYETPISRDDPRPRGYAARTVIRIRIVKLDQIGRVMDASLTKGATGIEGVQFESSSADEARRASLADASVAARRDAEALATALSGSVGPLLSVTTAGGNDPRRMNVMMEMAAGGRARGGTQIRPDEIVIMSGVVIRWEFVAGHR